jgi:hypothetical protein
MHGVTFTVVKGSRGAGRTPQGLNVNNLLLCYFFPSLLEGFQKALLADKIVAAFVRSTVLLLASATWMARSWMALLFLPLYSIQSSSFGTETMPNGVTCQHTHDCIRSRLLNFDTANLLTSVCKNFSKIVGEVFSSSSPTILLSYHSVRSHLLLQDGV